MTDLKGNGPAGDGAAQTSKAWTYREHSAAMRRRRAAALRLEPIRCPACQAWHRDPLEHRCTGPRLPVNDCPQHGIVLGACPFTHDCGCEDPMRKGHRNDTCTQLGELPPPRVGPGSRRR